MTSTSRISFEQAYKQVRNRLRRYHPDSVVREAIRQLQQPVKNSQEDVLRAPWQLLMLVKWACQDNMAGQQSNGNITQKQLDELRQHLWSLTGRLRTSDRETQPMRLVIRRMLRTQIELQRTVTKGFVREAALLSAQPADHPLRALFKSMTQLEPEEFIDFSLATFGSVAKGSLTIRSSFFDPLLTIYPTETISAFIACVSKEYVQYVEYFRSLPDARRKVMSELYEFPVVSRYPFLNEGGYLKCWHPVVFYRGMEGMVHSILSEAGQEYIERFSKIFEDHVVQQASVIDTPMIREQELIELIPPDTRTPDLLLSFPDCNVFVEAKSGLFDETLMTVGHNKYFAHKTRSLRNALDQAWSASVGLREMGKAPIDILNASTDILLVVTNKELSAGRGTALVEMYPTGTLDYPSEDAHRYLPLSNIYVVSVEDYERIMVSAQRLELDLPSFLRKCISDDSKPETAKFFMEQHLNYYEIPRHTSDLVADALDESYARLASCEVTVT